MELQSETDYDWFMQSETKSFRWVWVSIAVVAVCFAGYRIFVTHARQMESNARAQAAKDAIRTGEVVALSEVPDVSNAAGDYARALQRDTVVADRVADKYEAAAKAREQQSQAIVDGQ